MSLIKLVIHSLAIMASFKETVFLRTSLLIIISYFFKRINRFFMVVNIHLFIDLYVDGIFGFIERRPIKFDQLRDKYWRNKILVTN